jgi:hypothetical protein
LPHSFFSFLCVPESSPLETKSAPAAAIALKASAAEAASLTLALSSAGPTTTKSLCMTMRRRSPNPSSTNVFSSSGEWTRSTSASPRFPMAMACPEPTAIVLTVRPVFFSKRGTSTSRRPVSCVLVVVARMTGRFSSTGGGCVSCGGGADPLHPPVRAAAQAIERIQESLQQFMVYSLFHAREKINEKL